uniref:Uncharacterized protein n=1 Tax=Picea glauca TaxID=3330 RepID=A0A101LWD8_PICGL|nr:hypothetical protein ABT39_MTgene1671 [Picea glauca]QHR91877.1 hypothetical protein Q903MT_gene5913 [Picea sitchensis]
MELLNAWTTMGFLLRWCHGTYSTKANGWVLRRITSYENGQGKRLDAIRGLDQSEIGSISR